MKQLHSIRKNFKVIFDSTKDDKKDIWLYFPFYYGKVKFSKKCKKVENEYCITWWKKWDVSKTPEKLKKVIKCYDRKKALKMVLIRNLKGILPKGF